jgi:hypothetical protein
LCCSAGYFGVADRPSSGGTSAAITSLAQSVAKRLYDSGNGTINAEVTGRTTQIEVNADGTKTMLTGGTKTVYSWDTDKGGMSQKTETSEFGFVLKCSSKSNFNASKVSALKCMSN